VVGIRLRSKVSLKALHHCSGCCRFYEVFLNFRVSNSPPLEGLGVVGIVRSLIYSWVLIPLHWRG